MTVDTGQHDGTDAQAGPPGPASTDDDRVPASEPGNDQHAEPDDDQGDRDAEGDQDTDGGRGGRPNNREARFRRERNEAREERDQLRGQLDTLHRQIIGEITTAHGLPEVGLLHAAGHELASFIAEDGTVNNEKVIDAVRSTIARYGIRPRPRPPRANVQQGSHGTPAGKGGLGSVIDKALGRDG